MKIPNERIIDPKDGFGHFVLSCLTHLTPDLQGYLAKKSHTDGHNEVLLTIDEVEVPVEDVIVQWMNRYEAIVTERALEILRSKVDSIGEVMQEAKEEIDETLATVKEKVADSFDFSYNRWDDRFEKN